MACLEPTLDDPFGFGNGVTAESCPWWVRSMRVNDEAIIPMTISTNPGIQNYGAARLVGGLSSGVAGWCANQAPTSNVRPSSAD